MSEPLAVGRDEVLYLVCTHRRMALGQNVDAEGWRNVYRANGGIGGPFDYDTENPWSSVRLPPGVKPSKLGWAVLDPLLESVEGLEVDPSFDASADLEGEDGRHRQELLAWIFDRHLERGQKLAADRGSVQGGDLDFRLEYIGKAGEEALLRATGAHHKLPLILSRTLAYEPERLVYVLPCEIRVAKFEHGAGTGSAEVPKLAEAVVKTGLPRDLLIGAAEEALIAAVGAPQNQRSTAARRFPNSDAGERLVAAGFDEVFLAFQGLPEQVTVHGLHSHIDSRAVPIRIALSDS